MAQPLTIYKLITLYMLSKIDHPLTNSQIMEFILEKEYTNYFSLQQALSEMIDSQLLRMETVRNASYYRITDTGRSTLEYFVDEISPEIKEDANAFLRENGCQLQEEVAAVADYWRQAMGQYAVHMQLKERNTQVIDMTIVVPSEDAAKSMCSQWSEKCHDVYGEIMELFL